MRILFLAGLSLAAIGGIRFPDNPPPAHTGGFGEPTCVACHFDGDLNPPGGRLQLGGLEEGFMPGETHLLEVLLDKADMERAGFQLAVRYTDGRQAGSLIAVDDRVAVDTAGGIQYARQVKIGSSLRESGEARWQIEWRAPEDTAGVVFNIAANASNGDESPFGDSIYSVEKRLLNGVRLPVMDAGRSDPRGYDDF